VLDRYVAAVGGREALLALKTRAAEGTWAHMGLTTAADGRPAAVNRGKVDPFTVTTLGADGLLVTRLGFDGTTAIADRAAGKTTSASKAITALPRPEPRSNSSGRSRSPARG